MFHVVFGKTVPDISLNAVANLGYADCHFLKPVYPGATLNAVSEVIGLKENSNKKTGIVYVRSRGFDQDGDDGARLCALGDGEEARRECADAGRKHADPAGERAGVRARQRLSAHRYGGLRLGLAGSPHRFGDYKAGEKIDHLVGITVEDAEHMIATRLYQNTARVHFDHFTESKGRFGSASDLWRARDFTGAGAVVQRPRQCFPRRRDQWRTSCRAAVGRA